MGKKLKRLPGVTTGRVKKAKGERKPEPAPGRAGKRAGGAEKPSCAPVRAERTKASAKQAPATPPGTSQRRAAAGAKKETSSAGRVAGAGDKTRRGKNKRGKGSKRSWSFTPRTALVVILFALFIALSASPVARNLEATSRLKAAERELAKQRQVTRSLEREVEEARSFSFIEEEARKSRMVAPGEVLYLVTTDAEESKVQFRIKAFQSEEEVRERVRQMLDCTDAARPAGK